MSKLQKALLSGRSGVREFGLSRQAGEAARIFRSGPARVHDGILDTQIRQSIEKSVPSDSLDRLRAKIGPLASEE